MKKLMMVFAVGAAILVTGCSVTKVNYEKDDSGKVSYRLYRNDHWLKTSASGLRGGMTNDGKFEFSAEGMEASPSEEFNRTMQTYTTAFIQLAQIAAAAYNPSSSAAVKAGATQANSDATPVTVNVAPAASQASPEVQQSQTQQTPTEAECADCTDKTSGTEALPEL